MPRRIVEDSDDEVSDDKDAPVTKRKPAPVTGKQKLSASALGKRPAVPAKQAKAKGRLKSKQLSDKELGIRGAKEVVVLSDDDDFDPDDDDDDEDDEEEDDEETSSDEDEDEDDEDDDSDEDDEDPRRSAKKQKAPKVALEAPAASARVSAASAKVSYKEPGLDDTDILDDDEYSEDEEEELKFADDDDMPLSQEALQAAPAPATKHAYAVGQQVDAKHQAQRVGSFAAKWFSGVVRKVHGDGACDIDYADGDHEDKVPLKFIRAPRKLEAQQPVVPEALSVGDAVDGHYGTDEDELWWPATVTRLRANGSVDVRYDDGDVEEQKPRSRLRSQPLRGAEAAKAATEGEGGGGGGGSGTEIPSSSDA